MAYVTAEARQELLEHIASAVEEIGAALAALGEAYEQLDDSSADRLEEQLFRPVQLAYARAQRTVNGFAERHGLQVPPHEQTVRGIPSQGVKGFIEAAVIGAGAADRILSDLQDSLLPVEVGDPELRGGLAEVREILDAIPGRARDYVRLLGR
jgi:hypothetical protein